MRSAIVSATCSSATQNPPQLLPFWGRNGHWGESIGPLSTFDFPASVPAPVLTNFSLLFTRFRVRRSSRLNSHSCFRFRLCFRFVPFRSGRPFRKPRGSPPHLVFILLYICCRQLRWAVNCAACHHLPRLQLQNISIIRPRITTIIIIIIVMSIWEVNFLSGP